jgi:hypothetical protein
VLAAVAAVTRLAWGRELDSAGVCPGYYVSEDRPDADFDDASPATAERDLQRLVAEQQAARQAVADMPLDTIFVNPRWGEMSLRWALIHMIGEYAGHTGQADLIRERIDGRAGWWWHLPAARAEKARDRVTQARCAGYRIL